MKKTTAAVIVVVIACVAIGVGIGWYLMAPEEAPEEEIALKVFHAGSLIVPLEKLESEFEEEHPNVDLQRESSGSVEAVRKITEVEKVADVIALADYSLIPDMMMPEYANWYIRFAKNDMVLAYTDQSNYADEITGENWYEILREPDVKFGFSNPNLDPCGYRTPMVFKLAELHYNTSIFDLITDDTAITINETDGTYLIESPEHLEPRGKVTIRDKSVDLVHLVKASEIDYAFEYRSVAVQHGLKFVDLPAQIDLSSVEYEDLYKEVKVIDATGKIRTGKPIVYGITVPNNAINEELGVEFVKLLISEEGQDIFRRLGQTPIVPAEASGNLPEELDPFVKDTLKLATGSPYELGLIDALSKPFEEEYNCIVEMTKASTGQGLELGRTGRVDLTLGHSKEALDTYIEEGYGTDRQAVMHNYFVIVGPENDPAGIRGISNLTEAHEMIANTNSLYLSRGDEGGMHKREKAIWNELGIDPSGEDWYLLSRDFMMASLRIADEVGTYHMADSSTCTVMRDELSGLDLLVVGDPNRYEATAVNPEKYSNVNYDLANAFIEYITSPEGQTIIRDFGMDEYGEPLYYPDAVKDTLRLATGSPYELGLIDALSEPFEEIYNCKVEVTKAGSGKSLDLGREGKVDLVMVHAPEAEEDFIADGYGMDRSAVMYNDFVIVGPENDPAGIRGVENAAEAYKKIAETKSPFFSRGDNSGTHKKEMSIWNEAGITPSGDWYRETGKFMGATLKIASEEQGYFMTDRSTYITMREDINLEILSEGDPDLINHYSAIAVNPEKNPNVNYGLAKAFIEYIISPEGLTIISEFGMDKYGEPLYYPDVIIIEGPKFADYGKDKFGEALYYPDVVTEVIT